MTKDARTRLILTSVAGLLCLGTALVLALSLGPMGWPWSGGPTFELILRERLQRALLAALAGGALSASGLVFQTTLQNPLADPYVIGVAGGAALGGTLAMLLPASGSALIPAVSISAFAGGLAAAALVFTLSSDRTGHVRPYEALLIGVVLNAFASAVIMFLKAVVRAQKVQELLLWLMGSVSQEIRGAAVLAGYGGIVILGWAIAYRRAKDLNALLLGRDHAASLGSDPDRTMAEAFVGASLMVACAVSVAGLIGFVGLIVPHAVRLVLGSDHRVTLVASLLFGAAFLVVADTLTRVLFPVFETEAPLGVFTAIVGGPLFVYLLKRGSLSRGSK